MKKIIRKGTFETNSSSTHSLTLCTKETYEQWKKGELLFDEWEEKFVKPLNYSEEELKEKYFSNRVKTISNGILYENTYYADIKDLISKVEVSKEELDKYAKYLDENLATYDSYWEYSGLEEFEESYTTPGGETIIAFGRYGYDG